VVGMKFGQQHARLGLVPADGSALAGYHERMSSTSSLFQLGPGSIGFGAVFSSLSCIASACCRSVWLPRREQPVLWSVRWCPGYRGFWPVRVVPATGHGPVHNGMHGQLDETHRL
jgi:hypothetical protein